MNFSLLRGRLQKAGEKPGPFRAVQAALTFLLAAAILLFLYYMLPRQVTYFDQRPEKSAVRLEETKGAEASFTARQDLLCGVSVKLHILPKNETGKRAGGSFRFQLLDAGGRVLSEQLLPCSQIFDYQKYKILFNPIAGSAGKTYRIRLVAVELEDAHLSVATIREKTETGGAPLEKKRNGGLQIQKDNGLLFDQIYRGTRIQGLLNGPYSRMWLRFTCACILLGTFLCSALIVGLLTDPEWLRGEGGRAGRTD